MIRRLMFTLLATLVSSSSAASTPLAFSSAYVSRKDGFRAVEPSGFVEGQDLPRRKAAVGGYALELNYDGLSTFLSVEAPGFRRLLSRPACELSVFGDRVEFRLANGQPFAVIVRVQCYKNDPTAAPGGNIFSERNKRGAYLLVRGLKGYENLSRDVDVRTKDANLVARRLADAARR